MKRAYYGPYFRLLMNRIFGKKIIGQASKDELEIMCKRIANTISKVDSKRTEQEIYSILLQKLKIVYTEQLPAFSGAKGIAVGRTIFVDQLVAYKTINGDEEEISDSEDYQTIVHECIHKLQNPKLHIKGKSFRGFIEGATELMALRASRKNRSHHYSDGISNFPETAYAFPVAIMNQLEVLFGKELVEDYALHQNLELLDKVNDLLGSELFDLLRKDLNAFALNKNSEFSLEEWQDRLLERYFDREIENVQNIADARMYLSRLKQMDLARIRIKGNDTYREYYLAKLEALMSKYPELDNEEFEYKESEFFPELSMDEEIERLNEVLLSNLTPSSDDLQEFQDLNLDDYKRFRITVADEILEVTTFCGEIKYFETIDSNNRFILFYRDTYDNSFRCGIHSSQACSGNIDNIDELFAQSNTKISYVDGKMYLSVNPPLSRNTVDNQEMAEVPLNISKKDIYNRMLEDEALFIKMETFVEKIKRFFTKPKMLPPYSQVRDNSRTKSFRKDHELTIEEKKRVEQATVQSLKRNDEQPQKNENSDFTHDDI